MFRLKTAPAFAVALHLGALFAGEEAHEAVAVTLTAFSDALGIAYQIQDDLDDFDAPEDGDCARLRPSLLVSLAMERATDPASRAVVETLSARNPQSVIGLADLRALLAKTKAEERARLLLESYKEAAVSSLGELENANLKGMLRRVIGKVFNETEIHGWCREVEAENNMKPPQNPQPKNGSQWSAP